MNATAKWNYRRAECPSQTDLKPLILHIINISVHLLHSNLYLREPIYHCTDQLRLSDSVNETPGKLLLHSQMDESFNKDERTESFRFVITARMLRENNSFFLMVGIFFKKEYFTRRADVLADSYRLDAGELQKRLRKAANDAVPRIMDTFAQPPPFLSHNIKNTSSVQLESHQPAESPNDEHKENHVDFPTLKLSLR